MTEPREDGWEELRRLAEAATPGPWVPQSPTDGRERDWYLDTHYNEDGPEPVWADSYPVGEADIVFMATAVNYVRDRLAAARGEPEIERLRRIEAAARDLTENEPRGTLNRYRWNALLAALRLQP